MSSLSSSIWRSIQPWASSLSSSLSSSLPTSLSLSLPTKISPSSIIAAIPSISSKYFSTCSSCVNMLLLLRIVDWKNVPFVLMDFMLHWKKNRYDLVNSHSVSVTSNDGGSSDSGGWMSRWMSGSSTMWRKDKPGDDTTDNSMDSSSTFLSGVIPTILSTTALYTTSIKTAISTAYTLIPEAIIAPVQNFVAKNQIYERMKATLIKMIYMELWRTFWRETFCFLRNSIYPNVYTLLLKQQQKEQQQLNSNTVNSNYYKFSFWEMYAPEFLKRGMKSLFVKFVQSRIDSMLGDCFVKSYDLIGLQLFQNEQQSQQHGELNYDEVGMDELDSTISTFDADAEVGSDSVSDIDNIVISDQIDVDSMSD